MPTLKSLTGLPGVGKTTIARQVAADDAGSRLIRDGLTCSDRDAHRRRIESGQVDLPGRVRPDRLAVQGHLYKSMMDADVTLDTGLISVEAAAERLSQALEAAKQES